MSAIIYNPTISSEMIVNNIPYNYSPEETNRMLRELLERFRETQAQRSTAVVTEDYMELPPAEDEDEDEDEASEWESVNSAADDQVPLSSSERLADSESSGERLADSDSEEELQIQCQEITGKPLANLLVTLGECSICLDPIDQLVNVSNTRCGHTFHTHCFLRAIQSGSGNCPNCRALLVVKEDEDDDDDGSYDDSEYDSDEDSTPSVVSERVTLEQTATKLQNLGYSVADILAFYVGTTIRSETPEKYNIEFFVKMNEDLDGILDGSISLSQRDNRSYAAVARAAVESEASHAVESEI
jgi:hypothetical protein